MVEKSKIEEKRYEIVIDSNIREDYKKEMVGTAEGLLTNSKNIDDIMFIDTKIEADRIHSQFFYIYPGIIAVAKYLPLEEGKLYQIKCIGDSENQEKVIPLLERLVKGNDLQYSELIKINSK